MAQVQVLTIAALNALAVYFLSFFAAYGDGSSDGVVTVRWFGFGAIAITTAISLLLCARGKNATGISAAAVTLPVALALSILGLLTESVFDAVRPIPSALAAACKDVGARYLKSPTTPVRSIAYDWKAGDYPPQFNYIEVASNGHLSSLGSGMGPSLPSPIEFTEWKCCRFQGPPTIGKGLPYIRRPNSNTPYFGIAELSADALVVFRSSPVEIKAKDWNLTAYDLHVTDRRTGDTLATLRYMLDSKQRRGCGTTSDGVMDERAFVLKAIGVQ